MFLTEFSQHLQQTSSAGRERREGGRGAGREGRGRGSETGRERKGGGGGRHKKQS